MGYKNDLILHKVCVLSAWHPAILLQSLLTWATASDEIPVLAFDIHMTISKFGFKHNLRLIKKFVFLSLSSCLSVRNIDWKHDSRNIWNNCLGIDMQLIGNKNSPRTRDRPP